MLKKKAAQKHTHTHRHAHTHTHLSDMLLPTTTPVYSGKCRWSSHRSTLTPPQTSNSPSSACVDHLAVGMLEFTGKHRPSSRVCVCVCVCVCHIHLDPATPAWQTAHSPTGFTDQTRFTFHLAQITSDQLQQKYLIYFNVLHLAIYSIAQIYRDIPYVSCSSPCV